VLVEPDDAGSLAQAIHALWKDRGRLEQLGCSGARGVRDHYHVSRMAATAGEVYRSVSRLAAHA
jgi:hypothetical protein